MKLTAIRLARENLHNHKARSRLSTVGVVLSVFLVSLIFIVSDSLKVNIHQQLANLNEQTIVISGASDSNLLNLTTAMPQATLSNNDVNRLKYTLKQQANIDVNSNLLLQGTISFDNSNLSGITTVATSANQPATLNVSVANGDWFDDGDSDDKKWVVLGNDLANQLLGTDKAQNQVVDIKGQKFTVVGVLQRVRQPLSIMGYNIDRSAFMSLSNGQAIAANDNISQITITGASDIGEAKRLAIQSLAQNHSDSSDYTVDTGNNIASKLTELVNYLTIAACILVGVILLVSSISIANIMLVNVVERRREIGIRKAVGATTRNIMNQFLAEALIMSLRGGVVGLLLAYAVAAIALLFFNLSVTFSWLALGIGFGVPITIGIIAGVYPAYRAARQDIISALNQLT